jgi:hypothetical protein
MTTGSPFATTKSGLAEQAHPGILGRPLASGVPDRDDEDDLSGWSMYFTGKSAVERGTRSLQHLPHVRNFLDRIKTRARPIPDIESGYRTTVTSHLGNIAYRTGEKIIWDSKSETIPNSARASRLLTREHRPPWTLPGL